MSLWFHTLTQNNCWASSRICVGQRGVVKTESTICLGALKVDPSQPARRLNSDQSAKRLLQRPPVNPIVPYGVLKHANQTSRTYANSNFLSPTHQRVRKQNYTAKSKVSS